MFRVRSNRLAQSFFLFLFLLVSQNTRAQLDFPLSSSFESPIYLNPARAGDADAFRLSFNQRSQWISSPTNLHRGLLTADWAFKDSKFAMAITGSIDEMGHFQRSNIGIHLARSQKVFNLFELSLSLGLDQNYQRIDASNYIIFKPPGYDPTLSFQNGPIIKSYSFVPVGAISLKYKAFGLGAMYSGLFGAQLAISDVQFPGSWTPFRMFSTYVEYEHQLSEVTDITSQFHLLIRDVHVTVLSPQIKVRHKWAVLRLGYWLHGSVMAGAGVHFGKNDFLLMLHHSTNGAAAFGPTFEISYVRNLKAVN